MIKTERILDNTKRTPPRFAAESTTKFQDSLDDKNKGIYSETATYWRNGFPSLASAERHIGELIGAPKEHIFLTNSGMSALATAVEATAPTHGDIVIYGNQGYRNSLLFFQNILGGRGVIPIPINPGSILDIEQVLQKIESSKKIVKVLAFEPFANDKKMPVVDVKKLLELPVLQRINPIIILDNTLATDSILPLASILKKYPNLQTIVVESITKSYLSNEDNGGVIFTSNDELAKLIQIYRKVYGSTPGPSLIQTAEKFIPPTKDQFDKENRKIAQNTLIIARACEDAKGSGELFEVIHPGLVSHPNYEINNKISIDNATVPLFYINPIIEGLTSKEIVRVIERNNGLRDCFITESFGFPQTSILWEPNSNYVRIAGGLEENEKTISIANRFKDALSQIISIPTGEVFPFNNYKIEIRKQLLENCGQTCLEMIGREVPVELLNEGEVSPLDLLGYIYDAKIHNFEIDEFSENNIAMVLGNKKNTGRYHWYLRIGNNIIDPEQGIVELAKEYEQREINEIITSILIPTKVALPKEE